MALSYSMPLQARMRESGSVIPGPFCLQTSKSVSSDPFQFLLLFLLYNQGLFIPAFSSRLVDSIPILSISCRYLCFQYDAKHLVHGKSQAPGTVLSAVCEYIQYLLQPCKVALIMPISWMRKLYLGEIRSLA